MKKRIAALALAVWMLLSFCAFADTGAEDPAKADTELTEPAAEEPAAEESAAEEPAAEETARIYTVEELGYDRKTLTVASFTPLTGCFFTNMWGTGTSDADVKKLLHGYALTEFDVTAQNYQVNESAVAGYQVTTAKNGNREYNIFLSDDLYYSDGSKITAKDYAFTILMMLHPETAKTGADCPDLSYIVGAEDYAAGRASLISGLRVLSDTQLVITVNKNALPYFYELSYIAFEPYPISVIAPGCEVKDDGKGAYIANTRRVYSADLLKRSILDAKSGYMSHPTVTSGPYTLVSYDGKTAVFKKNTKYKDNSSPFETITYTSVDNAEAAELLSSKNAVLIHKAMRTDTVAALQLLTMQEPYSMSAYPRSGLSFISFCCEKAGVSEKEVRQAIAMCLDKESLTENYVGGYGTVTDGFWGIGQWMYQTVNGSVDYPTEDGMELGEWQDLSFDNVKVYDFDPEAAAELLEKNGWKLNGDGVREKKLNGETVTLSFTLICPEGNSAVEFFETEFAEALAEAGMELTVSTQPWETFLKLYYREDARTNDMFYLATNFEAAFNPAAWFNPSDEAQGTENKTGIRDEKLYSLARDMAKTEFTDTLGYCKKWLKFTEYMSEVMPVIPVYSNIYFDFYTSALQDYDMNAYLSWAQAAQSARLADVEGYTPLIPAE